LGEGMLGIDATFDDVLPDQGRDPRQVLMRIVPGAAALVLAGCVGVWVLHARQTAAPEPIVARPAVAPASEVASKPFGDIIVDPSFVAELKPASPADDASQLASLEAVPLTPFASPQSETAPPTASTAIPLPENVPLPPKRDVPQIADEAPLPPARPAEFGSPAAPENHVAEQNRRPAGPPAPVDNRNIFQKLLGLGQSSAPTVAGKAPDSRVSSTAPDSRVASVAPETRATFTAPEGRVTGRPLFGFFGPPVAPVPGYDPYTAIYDISARTVYLPDGTRLEAHSGLGDALDDPRYVSERMRGPTPPNVYELEPREASFHGVQALRLIPVGDNTLYGRAGLLAHSYMLGPNGDSNGCVSFRDYDAFLRAYQSGQVKKLVVVSRL
jgi:Protein of unknown function (DUF2778)